jgi:hypothetical protein
MAGVDWVVSIGSVSRISRGMRRFLRVFGGTAVYFIVDLRMAGRRKD